MEINRLDVAARGMDVGRQKGIDGNEGIMGLF